MGTAPFPLAAASEIFKCLITEQCWEARNWVRGGNTKAYAATGLTAAGQRAHKRQFVWY